MVKVRLGIPQLTSWDKIQVQLTCSWASNLSCSAKDFWTEDPFDLRTIDQGSSEHFAYSVYQLAAKVSQEKGIVNQVVKHYTSVLKILSSNADLLEKFFQQRAVHK